MPKNNFKDYSENYREIKKGEYKKAKELEKQEKLEDRKDKYESNEKVRQECLELKEYLDALKSGFISQSNTEKIRKNVEENIDAIQNLKQNLLNNNINTNILESSKDNLKDIYKQFGILLTATLIIAAFAGLISALAEISIIYSIIWFLITLVVLDFKAIEEPCIHKFFKVIIGMLPFNNRYSFVKTIRELEKLEKEYNKFSKQYEDYLKYLNNGKKSKAVEETKEVIEGNYRTISDIQEELLSKVKSLILEEEREKYLEFLAKLAKFYTREKEKIALKNGYNHSEEERKLDMFVLKQLNYIDMQINSIIYKNKNVNLLSEDYLTTLGKLDNANGKKLERTLGFRKIR